MRRFFCFLILGSVFSAPLQTLASDEYTFAKLLEEDKLVYPRVPSINGWEGWAYYSYIVGTDGLVHNIEILDSNGIPDFNVALVKRVGSRVYEPANYNGTPVEEASEVERAVFSLSGKPRAASKSFLRAFKKIKQKLAKHELSEARKLLELLRNTKIRSLYEELYIQTLYASYYDLAGDKEQQYLHIARILDFYGSKYTGEPMVEPEFFMAYLAQLYEMQVVSMKLGDALYSAEWLAFIGPDSDLSRQIESHSETIKKDIVDREFGMKGKLLLPIYKEGSATWKASLLRNEIELTDVVGRVDSVNLYCLSGRKLLPYSPGNGWILPKSWGRCTIFIRGEENTTFVVKELPNGTLSSAGG